MGFDIDMVRGPDVKLINTHGKVDEKEARRKKKLEHIRIMPPGVFFCRKCGDKYEPARPIALTIWRAIINQYMIDHKKCRLNNDTGLACSYCFEFGHELEGCHRLQYDGDPVKWWNGPDCGGSSKTLCWVMMGKPETPPGPIPPTVPRDPDDFGRCYRLLKTFGWRDRIGEMSGVFGWKKTVEYWDAMEKLYEEELPTGSCPRLYVLMCEMRGEEP